MIVLKAFLAGMVATVLFLLLIPVVSTLAIFHFTSLIIKYGRTYWNNTFWHVFISLHKSYDHENDNLSKRRQHY